MLPKLNRFGLFTDKNASYNKWRSTAGNLDTYESFVINWNQAIKETKYAQGLQDKINLIEEYIGKPTKENIEGIVEESDPNRDFGKDPLMQFIYNAGANALMQGMTSKFIKKFEDKLQDLYDIGDLKAINNLMLEYQNISSTPTSTVFKTLEDVKEFKISSFAQENITKTLKSYYARPMDKAIETEYGDILVNRKYVNKAVNTAYYYSNAIYETEKEKILEKTGNKFLTVKEDKELHERLKQMFPIVSTLYSTSLDDGLDATKTQMIPTGNDSLFRVEHKGSSKVANLNNSTYTSSGVIRPMKSAPGVSAIPLLTQSVDASVMSMTVADHTVLNIYDAIGVTENYEEAVQNINKNFGIVMDPNTGINIVQNVYDMFARTTGEIEKYFNQLDNTAKTELDNKVTLNFYVDNDIDPKKS